MTASPVSRSRKGYLTLSEAQITLGKLVSDLLQENFEGARITACELPVDMLFGVPVVNIVQSENASPVAPSHVGSLSEFVHAPKEVREAIGNDVAKRAIERQQATLTASSTRAIEEQAALDAVDFENTVRDWEKHDRPIDSAWAAAVIRGYGVIASASGEQKPADQIDATERGN